MSSNQPTWDTAQWAGHPFYKLIGTALRDLGIISDYPFRYSSIYVKSLSPIQIRHNNITEILAKRSRELNNESPII